MSEELSSLELQRLLASLRAAIRALTAEFGLLGFRVGDELNK